MEEQKVEITIQGNKHELVPLQADLDTQDHEVANNTFISELRHNKVTRVKFYFGLSLAWAYMILGWSKGQLGPALLDLMMITGANLEKGSWFMTSYYAGRLIGAVLAGVIYSKMNKYLLFVMSIAVNGMVVAAIPWCFYYEFMVAAHVIYGVSGGFLDVAIVTEGIKVWGPNDRGRTFTQILCAAFAFSSIIAPMATAPFLFHPHVNASTNFIFNNSSIVLSSTERSTEMSFNTKNISTIEIWRNTTTLESSQLYVIYSITAGITLLTTIPFVIFFLKSSQGEKVMRRENSSEFIGNLSITCKRLQLFNLGILSAASTVIDHMFGGYLSVFCVQYMDWTKTEAAKLTSTLFVCNLVGRFVGVIIVQKLKVLTLLLLSCLICTVGFVGITISSHLQLNIGIWLSVFIIGIPFGIIWPTFLSWVNENFIPINGKVTAYLLVSAFCGVMISPVLIGYLMENLSLLWFCYFCIISSAITISNVIFMFIYTIYHNDGNREIS